MILRDLGVVVIGRNEGERLRNCLKSLSDVKNVVYVDSGSTDDSVEEAKQQGVSVLRLDMTRPFTAARARNEGFAALMALRPNTQFVQFLDGDCELVKDWIEVAVNFLLERSDVAVVCGRRREREPEASVYNRLCDLEWDTPAGQTVACGGDSLMRVESFRSVGGFSPNLMAGEEPELCMRLREAQWKIWRLNMEMSLHDADITQFSQWWRRSVRCGYGYAEVWRLHMNSPAAIYRKETERALFWGGLVPVVIGVASLIHPFAILGVIIYPLQIIRIAVSRSPAVASSWTYAIYVMIAKFAEIQGVIRYFWNKLRGKTAQPIEYKRIHF